MARTPDSRLFEEVVKIARFPKYTRNNSKVDWLIRIVKGSTAPFYRLDIREFVESETYTGFTARGISLDLKQAEEIIDAIPKGIAELRKYSEESAPKKKGSKSKE